MFTLVLRSDRTEVHDLLTEDEVFQKRRSPLACAQAFLIFDRCSGVGSNVDVGVIDLELCHEFIGVRGNAV